MAVLTISREFASGGWEIGRRAAEKAGLHFADKKTIDKVFQQYGFLPFDKVYNSPASFWDRFDNMRRLTLENLDLAIRGLARHGDCVIVGRGSYAVLEGLADVVNVRIQAPFEKRVRHYMDREGAGDRAAAEKFIAAESERRASFVETTYLVSWDAASSFDLVINTEVVTEDLAVDWLVAAARLADNAARDFGSSAANLPVDPFVLSAVGGALGCKKTHQAGRGSGEPPHSP